MRVYASHRNVRHVNAHAMVALTTTAVIRRQQQMNGSQRGGDTSRRCRCYVYASYTVSQR